MSYLLSQFMSPLGIERVRLILAVTTTTLALAFAALIVLGVIGKFHV
jgi:hypothetical protein